jgi:uncharacterized membrane protein
MPQWFRPARRTLGATMNLLTPLTSALLVIHLVIVAVIVFALIDALRHPAPAYLAAGKLTKVQWGGILVAALLFSWFGFFSIIALIASLVYLLDVRPALRSIGSGGGSSSGPYGPW